MFNPFDRNAKVAPSHYPKVPFHLLRATQLVSSLIVGAIMAFFTYHLTHDHWPTPWTFIFLMAASLFSVAALAVTILLHCCVGLNPRFNIAVNSFLSLIWVLSWSMLTWWMSGTLRHSCNIENWQEDVGVMVCRIYKALFTFAFLGMLSTLAALGLDIYVRRQQNFRGIYKLHDLDSKRPDATRGPFSDVEKAYGAGGLAEPRMSETWDANPRPSVGPYEESGREPKHQGYAVPEGQFEYDTGYHGHAHADQ